jgi:excisionase family DNA binding protein
MARKTKAAQQRSSPEQAAAELGVSVRTLGRYVKAGEIAHVRERGLTYFTRQEIDRWKAQRAQVRATA